MVFDPYSTQQVLGPIPDPDLMVHTPVIHAWVKDVQSQLLDLKHEKHKKRELRPMTGSFLVNRVHAYLCGGYIQDDDELRQVLLIDTQRMTNQCKQCLLSCARGTAFAEHIWQWITSDAYKCANSFSEVVKILVDSRLWGDEKASMHTSWLVLWMEHGFSAEAKLYNPFYLYVVTPCVREIALPLFVGSTSH